MSLLGLVVPFAVLLMAVLFSDWIDYSARSTVQNHSPSDVDQPPKFLPDFPLDNPNRTWAGYDYCQAQMPSKAKLEKPHRDAKLHQLHVFFRHGDRSPAHQLPNEDNIEWMNCYPADELLQLTPLNPDEPARRVFRRVNDDMPSSDFERAGFWKGDCGAGQLTWKGHLQTFALGTALRSVYLERPDLWESLPTVDEAYVRSTDVWRTIQSAQSMVSALFPAKDAPSSYTKNAPTIHVRPRQVDTLTVFIPPFCPRLNELTAKRRGSSLRDITPEGAIPPDSAAIKKDSDALAMLKKVEDILLPHDVSGSPEKGWTTTFYLQRYFDTFQTRACHSKPMPCGPTGNRCIDEETAEKIKYLSEWQIWYEYLSARARSPEEAKLRFGPLMRDVVTSMQSPAIEGPADHVQPKPHDPLTHSTHSDQPSLRRRDQSNKLKRVFLYSAHDTTLSGLLGIFLELGERWPPYASILAVEVWNVPTNSPESGSAAKLDRWVRVMYNDRVLKSWCDNKDGFCTMDHFLRFLDPVLPKNFARECAMK